MARGYKAAAGLVASSALLLQSCGTGSEIPAELRSAVETYVTAPDAETRWLLWSPRCQEAYRQNVGAPGSDEMPEDFEQLMRWDIEQNGPFDVRSLEATIDGGRATVELVIEGVGMQGRSEQSVTWSSTPEGWSYDDCPGMGNDDGVAMVPQDEPSVSDDVPGDAVEDSRRLPGEIEPDRELFDAIMDIEFEAAFADVLEGVAGPGTLEGADGPWLWLWRGWFTFRVETPNGDGHQLVAMSNPMEFLVGDVLHWGGFNPPSGRSISVPVGMPAEASEGRLYWVDGSPGRTRSGDVILSDLQAWGPEPASPHEGQLVPGVFVDIDSYDYFRQGFLFTDHLEMVLRGTPAGTDQATLTSTVHVLEDVDPAAIVGTDRPAINVAIDAGPVVRDYDDFQSR